LAIFIGSIIITPQQVNAATAKVNLRSTANFAVLAGSTVTNTGSTVIRGSAGGDVGLSPGSSVTGFPPGTISDGTIHASDAMALQAKTDLVTAYNDAAGRTVTSNLTSQNLGGLTLTSGVYKFNSSAQLTGTLILDAQGNPDAAFIFQIGSTLTTASGSAVSLINEARYCRVFWQVGTSATIGTGSHFIGHIFAMTSITATTGATVQGQLLARNGAVTLDTNTITNGVCAAAAPTPTATPTPSGAPTATPSVSPTATPSGAPTATPSGAPTAAPSVSPTAAAPTSAHTATPTGKGSGVTKTGENGRLEFAGLILVGLAGGLILYLRRRKAD